MPSTRDDGRGRSREDDVGGVPLPPSVKGGSQPRFSSYYYDRFGSASPEEYMNLRFSHMNPKVPSEEIKEVLDDEFRRYGEFEVKIVKNENERLAYVNFAEPDAARKARKAHLVRLAGLLGKHLRIDPAGVVRDQSGRYLKSEANQMPPHMLVGGVAPSRGGGGGGGGGGRGRSPPPYGRQSSRDGGYDGGRGRLSAGGGSVRHYDNAPPSSRGGGGGSGRDRRGGGDDDRRSGGDQQRRSQRSSRGGGGGDTVEADGGSPVRMDLDTFKQLEAVETQSTRTLFLGNLPRDTTRDDLRRLLDQYGALEDVDIKTPADSNAAYGFACFENLDQAMEAKYYEQDRPLRSNGQHRVKIGYGKAVKSTRLYVGGLGPWTSVEALANELDRYGLVKRIEHVRDSDHAYVQFASIDAAAEACVAMRGFPLGGRDRCIRVDFAREQGEEMDYNRRPTSGKERKRRHSRSASSASGRSSGGDDEPPPARGPHTPPPPTSSSSKRRSKHRHRRDSTSASRRHKRGPQTPPDSPPAAAPHSPSSVASSKEEEAPAKQQPQKQPVDDQLNAATLEELESVRSPCWTGALVLKKSAYAIRLYKLTGDDDLIDSRLREPTSGDSVRLHVTQRLPFAGSGGSLADRFAHNTSDQFAYLIASTNPNATTAADLRLADSPSRPLKALIHYLTEKTAAGVVSLQRGAQVYVFPHCDFSARLLKTVAPNLTALKNSPESALLVILARTNSGGSAAAAKDGNANGK